MAGQTPNIFFINIKRYWDLFSAFKVVSTEDNIYKTSKHIKKKFLTEKICSVFLFNC